nr:MAG TPA: hypothetical protein [Caudoviricetes sp.]
MKLNLYLSFSLYCFRTVFISFLVRFSPPAK